MEIRFRIDLDTATPMLAERYQRWGARAALHGEMGRAVVQTTSRHVGEWGLSHPNKMGGTRTNHWAAVAAAINPDEALEVTDESAVMTLGGDSQAGITRAFGEVTITAGTRTAGIKFLAIPAREEAYGIRPADCPVPLRFVVLPRGGPVLIEAERQRISIVSAPGKKAYVRKIKGEGIGDGTSGGGVWYWLRRSVTQPQDRTIAPSDEQWTESATGAAVKWLERGGAK